VTQYGEGEDAVAQLRKSWDTWLRDLPGDPIKLIQDDHDFDSVRDRKDFSQLIESFKEELRSRRSPKIGS
jgi:hypothetical protein